MSIADNPPDIIMIVEVIRKTEVTPIDEARLSLPGFNAFYNFFFDPSLPNLGGSGSRVIVIFVGNSISVYEFRDVGPFHEQLWLSVPFVGSDSLLVGCIYCSLSSDTLTSTCQLCKFIELAASLSTHQLICGDFNCSNMDWITGCG